MLMFSFLTTVFFENDTTVMAFALKQAERAWSDLEIKIREYLNNQGQSALHVGMIGGVISRCASDKIIDCDVVNDETPSVYASRDP